MDPSRRANPQGKSRPGKRKHSDDSESVEVICRLTPYDGPNACLLPESETVVRISPPNTFRKRDGSQYSDRAFKFGYVFDESDSQKGIFLRCASDLVGDLMSGKSGLLFTYGVTGSGKTYTMSGNPTPSSTGIIPRTLDCIFNSIDNQTNKCVFYPNARNGFDIRSKLEAHMARKQLEMERLEISSEIEARYMEQHKVDGYNDNYVCSIFVSYYEIYNNYCYDLLSKNDDLSQKNIRSDMSGMVYVENLSEVEVDSSDEALAAFCKGDERRRTHDTLLNKESSRSHSVFCIKLVMAPFKDGETGIFPVEDSNRIVVSQLCLVDLAGSERVKRTNNTGERLVEAGNINKSLMTLRQCFEKLRKNQRSRVKDPVPYRDSKLTHLFKNFFEGSGRVRMIICANPKPEDFDENLNVLSFAEESQAVCVDRCENRLEEIDRPPVSRNFYSKWHMEVDPILSKNEGLHHDLLQTVPFPITGCDEEAIDRIRLFYENRRNLIEKRMSEFTGLDGLNSLTNFCCVSDFRLPEMERLKIEYEELVNKQYQDNAQIKQLKRENRSLHERLRRYEEEDDELIRAEEELRRGRKQERMRIQQQQKALQAIQDLVETPIIKSNVAQLRQHFNSGVAATNSPLATAQTTSNLRNNVQTSSSAGSRNTPIAGNKERAEARSANRGVGYYNPKYQRRSKSASRLLDHQPLHRVPTGGILQARLPPNHKHVRMPEMHDLQKSSDYILTHQEVDMEGNLSTNIVKGSARRSYSETPAACQDGSDTYSEDLSDCIGDVIPTAGGGTSVVFNDVERVTHEDLGSRHRRHRSSSRN